MSGVRDFFNSVAIIDDELLRKGKVGSKSQRPTELFHTLQGEGIVISPLPFKSLEDSLDTAVRLALNARLTILDWNLLPGSGDPAVAAIAIIQRVIEQKAPGLQWIIVYTRESKISTLDLLGRLRPFWNDEESLKLFPDETRAAIIQIRSKIDALEAKRATVAEMEVAVQEAQAAQARTEVVALERELITEPVNGVFVTFRDKNVDAGTLFQSFSDGLSESFGPLALPLIEISAELDRRSHRTMQEFSRPFDLSIYLHALTSELEEHEIAPFVFELYADSVLQQVQVADSVQTAMWNHRQSSVRNAARFAKEDSKPFAEFLKLLQDQNSGLVVKPAWKWIPLLDSLADASTPTDFQERLKGENLRKYGVWHQQDKENRQQQQSFKTMFELLCAYIQWRTTQGDTPNPHTFLEEVKVHSIRFTRLLKFNLGKTAEPIETGSIYRSTSTSTPTEYLVCISPYCDVVRPKENLENNFKFLVGRQLDSSKVTPSTVRDMSKSVKKHGTFIPVGPRLEFVVWDFYKTRVINPNDGTVKRWSEHNFSLEFLTTNITEIAKEVQGLPREQLLGILNVAGQSADQRIIKAIASALKLLDEAAATSETTADSDLKALITEVMDINPQPVLTALPVAVSPKESVFLSDFEFVGQLKREYVQQIVNKYVAYHSRAGVAEVYYKEWAEQLLPFFASTPT